MSRNVSKKVPELRFPEFKKKWNTLPVEKIALVSSGGTPNRSESRFWNGDIPWVTTSEIIQGEIFNAKEKITQEGLENSSAKLFEENTLLLAMYGQGKTRGQVAILRIQAATNQACAAITLKDDFNTEFIYYFLSKEYARLRTLSNDGSQKNLSAALIKQYQVPLPENIQEQEKIANFLGAVDARLGQLRRKRELLQTYKRGVMQKLFSQEIRFKQDDGSDFPDWEKEKLESLFGWIKTNSLPRAALNYNSGTIKNIHYGDIHSKFNSHFRLTNEEVPYITNAEFISDLDNESFCEVGDLIIADASEDYADIGKTIEIIEVEPKKLVAGLHCFVARKNRNFLAVGFAGYLFQSEKIRNQMRRVAQGISVLGISKHNLESIMLSYPHLLEQKKIVSFLGAIDHQIDSISCQIDQTEQFKKGLLQKMFV